MNLNEQLQQAYEAGRRQALIREAPLMKPDSMMPGGGVRVPMPGPNGLTLTPHWGNMVADCLNNGNCDNPCQPGEDCYKQWIIDTWRDGIPNDVNHPGGNPWEDFPGRMPEYDEF